MIIIAQQSEPSSSSHTLQLAAKLLALGIVENGRFTWVQFRHDDWCQTLRTLSSLDCRCDVEALIDGRTYSFRQFVAQQESELVS